MIVILKCVVHSKKYFYGSKTFRLFNTHTSAFVNSLQFPTISSKTQDHLFKHREKLLQLTPTEKNILFARCNSNIHNVERTFPIPLLCLQNHHQFNNHRKEPNKISFRSFSLACGLALLLVSCSQSMKGKDLVGYKHTIIYGLCCYKLNLYLENNSRLYA